MNIIRSWLEQHNLGEYAGTFERNRIDLSILRELSDQDLKELGVDALGHRKLLLRAIGDLNNQSTLRAPHQGGASADSAAFANAAERRQLTIMFCAFTHHGARSAPYEFDLHAFGDAEQGLDVMPDLVGDDIGLREIAGHLKAAG